MKNYLRISILLALQACLCLAAMAQTPAQPKLDQAGAAPAQVRVMADELSDTRRSDGFFNKLEVKLKLMGDALAEAKAVRLKVNKAVDETGKDLIGEKTNGGEFEGIDSSSGENAKVNIELKNPTRRAAEVTEISGVIELFAPRKDPAATVTIPGALQLTGKPLVNLPLP